MAFEGAFLVWTALAIFIPGRSPLSSRALYRTVAQDRSRSQALDVLRMYAEKGQEPPASVTSAISAVASACTPFTVMRCPRLRVPLPNRRVKTTWLTLRGASCADWVAAGIAWWRMPDNGEPGPLVIGGDLRDLLRRLRRCAPRRVFTTPSGGSVITDYDSALIDEILGTDQRVQIPDHCHQQAVRGFLRRLLAQRSGR